jgi:hypothetical protein
MTWECEHPFALFLLGAETPYWRKLLRENHASHVGINFKNLLERMNAQRTWDIAEHFPDGTEIMVDAGRSRDADFDHDAHAELYCRWVAANIERISLVVEYEGPAINREWRSYQRLNMLEEIPQEEFLPIWRESDGPDELELLASSYERVAIVKPSASAEGRLRVIAGRYDVKLHGLGITGPDDLSSLPLVTASSTSWIGPTQYGDTHVWAGGRFHWYPRRSMEDARRRHSIDIDSAGFDSDAFSQGDRKEVARYTIWAWQQYEAHLSQLRGRGEGLVVGNNGSVGTTPNRQNGGDAVGTTGGESTSRELVRRNPIEVFPGLAFRSEEVEPAGQDGQPALSVDVPVVGSSTLRTCNSCYLARRCPMFDPDSTCAYRMPLEIKTRPQLMASLQALLEMQFSRVIFARAAEEMDGSVVNADTSLAIKDYMGMVKTLREIETDPNFLRIEARGPAAQGILSQLLGSARAESARERTQQVDPERAERFINAQVHDYGED